MPWSKDTALARIRGVGLVPIVRTAAADEAWCAVEGVASSGAGIIEITMNTPDAARIIERIVRQYGSELLVGAGTVVDQETCAAAVGAGAEFIVTPAFDRRLIEAVGRAGKACIPGALTPTEVQAAWQAGADIVKVFPCMPVGGPAYIRALKGPFPQIPLLPTGGVTLAAIPEFIRAGVAAVGVAGDVLDPAALRQGKLDVIRSNVRACLEAVRSARAAIAR
jgi:2-dehydro-3-deoxyphosphogluconate aldolase/(4S)-4-hydroxy-2-oxoglutarate aldolase